MNSDDLRLITHAQGYVELELPLPALDMLRQVDPRSTLGYEWNLLMGEAKRLLSEHASATAFFKRASTIKPDEVGPYIGLGWCLKRTDRLNEAIRTLETALERILPDDDHQSLLMYNLSCYESLAGHLPQCLTWLGKALALRPNYRTMIDSETDFDPVRDDPSFIELINSVALPSENSPTSES